MATASLNRDVPSGTGSWTVAGSIDTTTQVKTFQVLGSSGRTIYSGSAEEVRASIQYLLDNSAKTEAQTKIPVDKQFYISVANTVSLVEGSLSELAVPVTQDTAQRDVVNSTSPATVAAGTNDITNREITNLQQNIGPDFGVVPNISDKKEPDGETITLQLREIDVTACLLYTSDAADE